MISFPGSGLVTLVRLVGLSLIVIPVSVNVHWALSTSSMASMARLPGGLVLFDQMRLEPTTTLLHRRQVGISKSRLARAPGINRDVFAQASPVPVERNSAAPDSECTCPRPADHGQGRKTRPVDRGLEFGEELGRRWR